MQLQQPGDGGPGNPSYSKHGSSESNFSGGGTQTFRSDGIKTVTGRFVTRRVGETIHLTLIDGTVLEGTPVHPIWSVDRDDFVDMSGLQPGERLQTSCGPLTIATIAVRHVPVPVYSIEVRGQHVYQLSDVGVLVHNARSCITELEVRPYSHFADDINKYDDLTGHELLQSVWIRHHHKHSRQSSVGGKNPAIALYENKAGHISHASISREQKLAKFEIATQTARRNALENAKILVQAGVPKEKVAELLAATRKYIIGQGW